MKLSNSIISRNSYFRGEVKDKHKRKRLTPMNKIEHIGIAVKNFVTNLKRRVFDEYRSRDYYDKKNFKIIEWL
jgi:hypothetical protein